MLVAVRRTFPRLRDIWRRRADVEAVHSVPPWSLSAPPRVLDDPIPVPPELTSNGSADFRCVGDELYRDLLTFCRLGPTHHVLDVSCGYAPAARPLSRWLLNGAYDGIDWDPEVIAWCREIISRRFPNFRFRPLHRENETLKYPHSSNAFQAVLVWELLTRTPASEAEQYVAETARVLRPGGRALMALYLLNEDSRARRASAARLTFPQREGPASVECPTRPDLGVAYDEDWIDDLLERNNLEVTEPVHLGRWAGREDGLADPDLVVTRKRESADTADHLRRRDTARA
jgi:SAM-dependent methyltransferase